MKNSALVLGVAAAIVSIGAAPARAQFGGISGIVKKAETAKKIVDLKVTDAEERQIGQEVSDKIVQEFGVYQDANVAKYVTLVGVVLAQASSRPNLDWQFVVLDTEAVNAFAAPGGYVHVTKGLLGLIKNEAELAGVLAHEILHVTEKHTVTAITKGDSVQLAANQAGSSGGLGRAVLTEMAKAAYSNIIDNQFSRGDENGSDEKGVQLANKVGYAPGGLSSALTKLAERNKESPGPNGLFASHPDMKDRIAKIEKVIRDRKLSATATVPARYAKNITFDAKPVTALALVASGSRGLAGGEKPAGEEKAEAKKEEKPKGGGLLGALRPGSQKQQSGVVASAGARGVDKPDRDAVGGPNKNRVPVKIGPADVAEFQKGIA